VTIENYVARAYGVALNTIDRYYYIDNDIFRSVGRLFLTKRYHDSSEEYSDYALVTVLKRHRFLLRFLMGGTSYIALCNYLDFRNTWKMGK
jgi:hypothetical protein